MQKNFREFMRVTEPLIQRGIDKGEFINVDPTEASYTLGAIFEGSILLWSYDPEEIDMMIDVLYRLDFIVQKDKSFIISDKGKNVLNYFKDDYGTNKITARA